jgi:hypothetical protein
VRNTLVHVCVSRGKVEQNFLEAHAAGVKQGEPRHSLPIVTSALAIEASSAGAMDTRSGEGSGSNRFRINVVPATNSIFRDGALFGAPTQVEMAVLVDLLRLGLTSCNIPRIVKKTSTWPIAATSLLFSLLNHPSGAPRPLSGHLHALQNIYYSFVNPIGYFVVSRNYTIGADRYG